MAAPQELNGTLVLVVIDGAVVGQQRGATFSEANAEIDYSSKDQREMKAGYGRYSSTIDLEMLYIPAASGVTRLKTAARNGEHLTLVKREDGDDLESADVIVTTFDQNAPDQDATVMSVSFRVNGPWTTL